MRGKDQYEMVKDDKTGKATVQKLGVGAKQRDGFEYEFTCTFLIDQKTNTAEVQKDNTHIFEGQGATLLTEEHGKRIIQWANTGEGYTPVKRNEAAESDPADELKKIRAEIIELAKELGGTSNDTLMNTLKEFTPSGNPNAIKDVEVARKALEKIKEIKEK